VPRPRLEERLTAAARGPVTLVSAGPGYGKTLSAAYWATHRSETARAAWLSVDESDNNPQAFWSDVLGALTIAGALPARSMLLDFAPAAGFGPREARQVRAGLAELPETVTLVLDDFHLVDDRAVLESIGQLLEHQPPQLRLVILTRSDPTLRLNRLRINGDLTDIRADDLAFTRDEAVELLHGNGLHPSPVKLGVLLDRTQGWAAGLQLAMMCLDPQDVDRGIDGFTGRDRLVAEYLIEEVTNRLPAADRDFLLAVSVADRISGALANELTGRSDGQIVLERLTARNALLVGLAGSSEWFRLHPMLRDLLAHRLALEEPGAVQYLHQRASRWFAEHGEPIQAIRHAAAGQHWDETGRLLTDAAWPLALTSGGPALVAALEPAAERALTNPTTGTLLACAVRDLHRRDYGSMIRSTDAADALLADVPLDDRYPAEALIGLLRVAYSRIRDPLLTTDSAKHLLRVLDLPAARQLPTARQHRAIAAANLAIGQLWCGEFDSAEASLSSVRDRCHELGLGLTELSANAHLALLDVIHGRLPDADRRARLARDIADRSGWIGEPQALGLYAAIALTELEQGRLDSAAATVDDGLTISRTGSDAACRVALGLAAIGVATARGDAAGTGAALQQLDAIQVQAGELPLMLARWCTVARAEAHLIAADPEAAVSLIGDRSSTNCFTSALEVIVLAKARLMMDQPAVALELLELIRSDNLAYRGPVIESRVLAAVATDRLHRDSAALTELTEAIDLAQEVGSSRPFLTAGPRVSALLARHRHVVARHLEFTRSLTPEAPDQTPVTDQRVPLESLTERERAVLGYLPTMLKSAEIASDLFVTINTVKSHQQAIYRKLGVTTRRDAVDAARALHLL
jgi:LuxR family maltose regulon positive regulatory protein